MPPTLHTDVGVSRGDDRRVDSVMPLKGCVPAVHRYCPRDHWCPARPLPAIAGSRKDAAHANFVTTCGSAGSIRPAHTACLHCICITVLSRLTPDHEEHRQVTWRRSDAQFCPILTRRTTHPASMLISCGYP